jgi:hypothetical protein
MQLDTTLDDFAGKKLTALVFDLRATPPGASLNKPRSLQALYFKGQDALHREKAKRARRADSNIQG